MTSGFCVVDDLQILQNDVKGHQKNYDYVNQTGQQLVNKCSGVQDIGKLQSHLDSLQRWSVLVDGVNHRVDQCQSFVAKLKHYQVLTVACNSKISRTAFSVLIDLKL